MALLVTYAISPIQNDLMCSVSVENCMHVDKSSKKPYKNLEQNFLCSNDLQISF